jgi:hypothetical protein
VKSWEIAVSSGQRVDVLVAISCGKPIWVHCRVIAQRATGRFDVRADDGRRFPGCHPGFVQIMEEDDVR